MSSYQKLLAVVSLALLTETHGSVSSLPPDLMNLCKTFAGTRVVLQNFPLIDWMQRDEYTIDVNGTCEKNFEWDPKILDAQVTEYNPSQILYEDVKLCDRILPEDAQCHLQNAPIPIHVAMIHYHGNLHLAIVVKTIQRRHPNISEIIPEYNPVNRVWVTKAEEREVVFPLFTKRVRWGFWGSGIEFSEMDGERVYDFEQDWKVCSGRVRLPYADLNRMDIFSKSELDEMVTSEYKKADSDGQVSRHYWWSDYDYDLLTVPACTAVSKQVDWINIDNLSDDLYRYSVSYSPSEMEIPTGEMKKWIVHHINDGIDKLLKKFSKLFKKRKYKKEKKDVEKIKEEIQAITQEELKSMRVSALCPQLRNIKILVANHIEKKKNYTFQTDESLTEKKKISKKQKPDPVRWSLPLFMEKSGISKVNAGNEL